VQRKKGAQMCVEMKGAGNKKTRNGGPGGLPFETSAPLCRCGNGSAPRTSLKRVCGAQDKEQRQELERGRRAREGAGEGGGRRDVVFART